MVVKMKGNGYGQDIDGAPVVRYETAGSTPEHELVEDGICTNVRTAWRCSR